MRLSTYGRSQEKSVSTVNVQQVDTYFYNETKISDVVPLGVNQLHDHIPTHHKQRSQITYRQCGIE